MSESPEQPKKPNSSDNLSDSTENQESSLDQTESVSLILSDDADSDDSDLVSDSDFSIESSQEVSDVPAQNIDSGLEIVESDGDSTTDEAAGKVGDSADSSLETSSSPASSKSSIGESTSIKMMQLFKDVQKALDESKLGPEIQKGMQSAGFRPITGYDNGGTLNGEGSGQKFTGFSFNSPDLGEVSTKVYENGVISTSFGDKTLKVDNSSEEPVATVEENNGTVRTATSEDLNQDVLQFQANEFTGNQKADGRLVLNFDHPAIDGATSVTLYPPNSSDMQWSRSIPESESSPSHDVHRYTDGSTRLEFASPLDAVSAISQDESGQLKDIEVQDELVSALVEVAQEPIIEPKWELNDIKPEQLEAMRKIIEDNPDLWAALEDYKDPNGLTDVADGPVVEPKWEFDDIDPEQIEALLKSIEENPNLLDWLKEEVKPDVLVEAAQEPVVEPKWEFDDIKPEQLEAMRKLIEDNPDLWTALENYKDPNGLTDVADGPVVESRWEFDDIDTEQIDALLKSIEENPDLFKWLKEEVKPDALVEAAQEPVVEPKWEFDNIKPEQLEAMRKLIEENPDLWAALEDYKDPNGLTDVADGPVVEPKWEFDDIDSEQIDALLKSIEENPDVFKWLKEEAPQKIAGSETEIVQSIPESRQERKSQTDFATLAAADIEDVTSLQEIGQELETGSEDRAAIPLRINLPEIVVLDAERPLSDHTIRLQAQRGLARSFLPVSAQDSDAPFELRLRGSRYGIDPDPETATIRERAIAVSPFSIHRHSSFPSGQQGLSVQEQLIPSGLQVQDARDQLRIRTPFDLVQRNPLDPFSPFSPTGPGSLFPQQLDWLPAAEGVRAISTAKNGFEAYEAVRQLGDLADNGDPHAQTALAATMLALVGGENGLYQAGRTLSGRPPVFSPDLSNLSENERAMLKTMVQAELMGSMPTRLLVADFGEGGDSRGLRFSSRALQVEPMSREAVLLLATAFEHASKNGNETDAQQLKNTLRFQSQTREGAGALWQAVHSTEFPPSDELEEIFIDSLNGPSGEHFVDSMVSNSLRREDPQDIRLLSRALSRGELSQEQSSQIARALRRSARDGNADMVFAALTESFTKNGDRNRVLESLGAIASDGSFSDEQTAQVMDHLRKGIDSDDSSTHDSAIKGFMQLSSQWTEADMRLLSDNMSETIANGIKNITDRIDPSRARQLAQLLEGNLADQSYDSAEQVTAGVASLGALSSHASDDAPQIIKDAVTADRFADSDSIDDLTVAGIQSLMAMGGSRNEGSEKALELLKESGWHSSDDVPMAQESFRNQLAGFVTGDLERSELSDEAKNLAYNSGYPQSIHSLFRERGVGANVLDGLVDKARENYDDATIRDILSRAELYNSLPQPLKEEVVKSFESGESQQMEEAAEVPGRIDPVQVLGQMANGTFDQSSNALLLNPIEDTVSDIRDDAALEGRYLTRRQRKLDRMSDDQLDDLVRLTSQGVSTWDHFTTIFGNDDYYDFMHEQHEGIVNFDVYNRSSERTGRQLSAVEAKQEALSIALESRRYERLRSNGDDEQADRMALRMLRSHGQVLKTLAPQVWNDLGFTSESADGVSSHGRETVWQRLHRAGLAASPDAPQFDMGTRSGFNSALQELRQERDTSSADTSTRRALALQALDTEPSLLAVTKAARDLQSQQADLQRLVQAGLQGTRTESYVDHVKQMTQSFELVYNRMNTPDTETGRTPAQDARSTVQTLKESLPDLAPDMRQKVEKRIEAMEQMLDYFDPTSDKGMQMTLMFDQVNSNDFDESTFANWLKSDGLKTLGAIAGGVAAAALVISTCGAATPLAIAAVAAAGAAGGVVGYEATAEALYLAGTGERTGSLTGHALREGLIIGEDGKAREITGLDVLENYGKQFGRGFLISLATMGLGNIFGKAIMAARGTSSTALSSNASGFGRLASRMQQVEQAAEKVGGKALMRNWMAEFQRQLPDELVEETMQQGADLGMQQLLGDVNPVLSVMASALIANRRMGGGFDLSAKPSGEVDVEISPDADAITTMSALQAQLEADGLQVNWDGKADSSMNVATPEGEVLTLKAKVASGSVESESDGSVNDQSPANTGNASDVDTSNDTADAAIENSVDTTNSDGTVDTSPTDTSDLETDSTDAEMRRNSSSNELEENLRSDDSDTSGSEPTFDNQLERLKSAMEARGMDAESLYLDDVVDSESNSSNLPPELANEYSNILAELADAVEAGDVNTDQVDELLDLLNVNLENKSNNLSLQPYMDAFIRSPNGAQNLESYNNLFKAVGRVDRSQDLVSPVEGELQHLNQTGWKVKRENGQPVMRNGKFVLEHNGEIRVRQSDVAKLNRQGGNWTEVESHSDGTVTMKLSEPEIDMEVEVSPIDLMASQMFAYRGGEDTCSACVTAYLMNMSQPGFNMNNGNEIMTPDELQRSRIGRVGEDGKDVDHNTLLDFIYSQAEMDPVEVKPIEFGKHYMGEIRGDVIAEAGPGLYVATSKIVKDSQGNFKSHTFLISVDESGNVSMIDPYNATQRVFDPGFRLETLHRLTGDNAQAAMRNMGLIDQDTSSTRTNQSTQSAENLDTNGDATPNANRRSSGNQDTTRTPEDIQIENLVSQLDAEIQENGQNTEAGRQIEQEIKNVLTTRAQQYAQKMGLVIRNPDGSVARHLVDPAKIEFVRGTDASSYDQSDVIRINLDGANPTADLFHEMKHRAEVLERTAMRMGDPTSYDHRVQQDVFGELGQGGNKRLKIEDGKVKVVDRSELKTKEQKQQLASLLTEFGQDVTALESESPQEIDAWLANRAQVDYFNQQGIDRAALVDLMSQEIENYRIIRDQSVLPADAAGSDSAVSDYLDAKQEGYAQRSANGQPVANDPRARKLTNGITEETIGIAGDDSHYHAFSPSERRAEAAELARSMGIRLDQADGEVDLGNDRKVMQLHQTSLALNSALAKHRSESDPAVRDELWSEAEGSAQKLVEMLPENDLGRDISKRLVDMGLIDNSTLPAGLRVSDSPNMARAVVGSDVGDGGMRRQSSDNPLDSNQVPGSSADVQEYIQALQLEIRQGGRLEGHRLERVRDNINELMQRSPELKNQLEPFANQLAPPEISGRTEQVKVDLNSSNKSVRDSAVRFELLRLMTLDQRTSADVHEITRLRRKLFDSMKVDQTMKQEITENEELSRLYDKEDSGQGLTKQDEDRMQELGQREADYLKRVKANRDFTLDILRMEAESANSSTSSSKGGNATEALIMREFEKFLDVPNPSLQNKTPAEAGYEVLPLVTGSAMDDGGADFVLVNRKTGEFVFVDPTQEPVDSQRKSRLPELRKNGVISSDPRDSRYTLGDDSTRGGLEYKQRREAHIRSQIKKVFHQLVDGSPLNISDMIVPPTTPEGRSRNSMSKADRVDFIKSLDPQSRALEIRNWRTELNERREGLNEMVDLAKQKAKSLREEATIEQNQKKASLMREQAKLLEDWHEHTSGNSNTYSTGSPLVFINRTLSDLDRLENGLPEQYRRFSRDPARPGESMAIPDGFEQELDSING